MSLSAEDKQNSSLSAEHLAELSQVFETVFLMNFINLLLHIDISE